MGLFDTTDVSGTTKFVPLYNLSGIKYNYINECPLNFKCYGYNLSTDVSAYIYAETFNTKNNYDNNYDVNTKLLSSTDISTVKVDAYRMREYTNIGSNGDVLYAVFKNNRNYTTNGSVSLSSNITDITYNMTPTSAFANSGTIVTIPLLSKTPENTTVYDKYDNVEVINSINRIKESTIHKTNIFSINIQNANINTSDMLSDTEKENIKRNLNNIINSMIKNIIPANTQLFKVYWNGE